MFGSHLLITDSSSRREPPLVEAVEADMEAEDLGVEDSEVVAAMAAVVMAEE